MKPGPDAADGHEGQTENESSPPEFEKFVDLARKIITVPKAEADEQREKWQGERRKKRPHSP